MRRSLLYPLIFLLLISFAAANMPAPSSTLNIYLDGKALDQYDLREIYCLPESFDDNPYLVKMGFDPKRNCTWTLRNETQCIRNPCTIWSTHDVKLYLLTDNKIVTSDVIPVSEFGFYDVFLSSDGSVSVEFLSMANSQRMNLIRGEMLYRFLGIVVANALIECSVAFFFFKKNKVSYTNIWWVFGINAITFIIFYMSLYSMASLETVLVAELLIILIEAFAYWLAIKQLGWNKSFRLSFVANMTTITVGLLIAFVLPLL